MRVLIVASRYLPHRGGLEIVVRELSKRILRDGHTIMIITNRYPHSLPKREVIEGVPVIRLQFLFPRLMYLENGRFDLLLAGLVYFPFTLGELLLIIQKFKPDVVNIHYLGNPGLFIWLLHIFLRFRLVVSLHGGDVDGEPHRSHFNYWLFRAVVSRAQCVTACSHALLDQALALCPEIAQKALVIHNGVDIALFSHAPPYQHPRSYLLAVGQLEKHKGFDLLISAFARIANRFPATDLLIAGDGSQRISLEAQIQAEGLKERVHLLGKVDQEKIASLMRGCLAVVIPSRREAFGIVALEARAAGKPIIASRVDGLLEVLKDTDVLWVSPNDVKSLQYAISHFLSERANMCNYQHISDDSSIMKFSWDIVYKSYLQSYGGNV